jgi:uncharacterized protein with PIN domain
MKDTKQLLELLAEQNTAMNRSYMKGYQKGYAKKEQELKEQENKMVEKMYADEQEAEGVSRCPKCGDEVLGDEPGLCGRCV